MKFFTWLFAPTVTVRTEGGDGPKALDLDPAPANFLAEDRASTLAPYQAFNTVRLGVDGTSMEAFPQFTEDQVWDLAFYVKSLYASKTYPDGPDLINAREAAQSSVTLTNVATQNDAELAALMNFPDRDDAVLAVASLRTARASEIGGGPLSIARRLLGDAVAAYGSGDIATAQRYAVEAYLQGVEPIEPSLRADDPRLTADLEQAMLDIRSLISDGVDTTTLTAAIDETKILLSEAEQTLADRDTSPWFAFVMALSILLREGLEAFLIIIAILGVIHGTGKRRALKWVHGGWIAAVLLGLAGWFISDLLLVLGPAEREIMEGGIALLAVVVLLYVGFWLHDKTSTKKWKAFIDDRIHRQLSTGNLWGLFTISFFAVFREAFESVLFLSALTLEEGSGNSAAVGGAAATTFVLLMILGYIIVRYSARIPLKQLFSVASVLMGLLAVVLVGKGIHALQEAGKMSITAQPLNFRFDLMGFFSYRRNHSCPDHRSGGGSAHVALAVATASRRLVRLIPINSHD